MLLLVLSYGELTLCASLLGILFALHLNGALFLAYLSLILVIYLIFMHNYLWHGSWYSNRQVRIFAE